MPRFLLAGLLAALASPTLAATPDTGVISKDGVEVTILPAVGSVSGTNMTVVLDVEARADDVAQHYGFRSLRVSTLVDCEAGENQVLSAQGYAQAGLQGDGKPWPVSGKRVRPAADSYMAQVITKVCANANMTTTPTVVTTPPPTPIPVPTPTPTPTPKPTPIRVTTPPPVVTPTPKPKSRPVVAVVTPAQQRPGVLPPGGGRAVAQVTASPTAPGAQRVLDALRALIVAPLTAGVEPATVNGAKVFRANVSGFSSEGQAKAFCLRAAGVAKAAKSCWVRPVGPR